MNLTNDYTILNAGDLLALVAADLDAEIYPGESPELAIARVVATAVPTDWANGECHYFLNGIGWTSNHGAYRVIDTAAPADIDRLTRRQTANRTAPHRTPPHPDHTEPTTHREFF